MSGKFFLYCAFVLSYMLATLILLLDGFVDGVRVSSLIVSIVMFVLYFVYFPEFDAIRSYVAYGDRAVIPWFAIKLFQAIGPFVSIGVVIAFHLRGKPAGGLIHWFLLSFAFCSFCLSMLFRPVSTDFGGFFPLCCTTVSLTLRDYDLCIRTGVIGIIIGSLMGLRSTFDTLCSWINASNGERNDALNGCTGSALSLVFIAERINCLANGWLGIWSRYFDTKDSPAAADASAPSSSSVSQHGSREDGTLRSV